MKTLLLFTLLLLFAPTTHALTPQQTDLINKAGNTSVEVERYQHLLSLSELDDLDPQLRTDLDILLPSVDLWANERKHWTPKVSRRSAGNSFLCGYIRGEWPPAVSEASPLYPIWASYRGRALIQRPIQSGPIQRNPERRAGYFDEARRLLNISKSAFPENKLVRMYLDETFPWPSLNPPDPDAPEWANLQRETLERMNGGYTSYMSDVEHTGEDSGDTCTSMMHLRPDDPVWQAQAHKIFTLFRDLWTGQNERGHLQFKSTYFTSEKVDTSSARACDTVYHPRAVQPALLYWQRTADPEMTALFSDWMKTWVSAAAGTNRNKPSGIIPSAIHWPDGDVGGVGENWWDPRNHGENTLYLWPSAMRMMTNTLLLTSHMTGDSAYLDPVRSMARARERYLANPVENPEPGTEAWCASRMGIAGTLAKYRLLTGDKAFDDLLLEDANGYVKYRMTGDRKHLIDGLDRSAAAFRINRASYMEEVRWTDRQLAFNSRYANHYADPKLPNPSLGSLYGSVTGDFGNALYFPMNAVRWKTTSRDIAVLVTESGKHAFSAELYHFGHTPREMGAELYLLDSGNYEFILTNTVDGSRTVKDVSVTGPRTQIAFDISPGNLFTLQIRKKA